MINDMQVKRISDDVYAKTEQLRHEAEVRHVAKQKVTWIREHLGKVKEKRGEAEYHRLRNAVLIEREKLKNHAAG